MINTYKIFYNNDSKFFFKFKKIFYSLRKISLQKEILTQKDSDLKRYRRKEIPTNGLVKTTTNRNIYSQ